MVDQSHAQFDRRIASLTKKHQAMSRGYSARLRPDGLIVVKPRRKRLAVSPKAFLMFAAAFFAFKGFLLASLGATTYEQRLERLNAGTSVERAGAWVMQIDPLSQVLAQKLGALLR